MSSLSVETETSDTSVTSLLQSQTDSSLSRTTTKTTTNVNNNNNNNNTNYNNTSTRTMEGMIWKDIVTENDLLDSSSVSGDTRQHSRSITNRMLSDDDDYDIRANNARMEAHMNYLEIKVGVLAEQNKRLRLMTAEMDSVGETHADQQDA
ncbi:hypothetical protein CsatA_030200 [Cannabis sativa]